MEFDFHYFYVLKFGIVVLLLWLAARPVLKQYKKNHKIEAPKQKYPYIIVAVLLTFLLFNPVKFDTGSQADRMRKTYDTPIERNIDVVKTQPKERYQAPSNKTEIERITKEK